MSKHSEYDQEIPQSHTADKPMSHTTINCHLLGRIAISTYLYSHSKRGSHNVFIPTSIVDVYQVCSKYALGTKNGPTPESHVLHRLI